MTETARDVGQAAQKVVEFRIHGIGNQPPWHALGRPREILAEGQREKIEGADESVGREPNRFVKSFEPPETVTDNVWLINWARTSRRTARFAWFVAIPFTMVNVAGHMHPAKPQNRTRAAVLTACAHVCALLLSLIAFVWLVTLSETALKYVPAWDVYLLFARLVMTILGAFAILRTARRTDPFGRLMTALVGAAGVVVVWFSELVPWIVRAPTPGADLDWVQLYPWLCALVGAGLAALVVIRFWRRPESRTPSPVMAVHVALFAACAWACLTQRPARWVAPDWLPNWLTVPRPSSETCAIAVSLDPEFTCQANVDVLTLIIVLTTGLAVVLAVILLIAGELGDRSRPNLPGAAALLFLAVLMMHTAGSVTRLCLDWLLYYVHWLTSFVDSTSGWPTPTGFRVLTPFQSPGTVYRPDLVVLAALIFAVAFALALTAAASRKSNPESASRLPAASGSHRIVQGLGSTLAPALGTALLLFCIALIGVGWLTDGLYVVPGWALLVIVLIVQAAAVFIALLIAGRLAKVRDLLERFADVAGFWRVRLHPLTGASYRPRVLKGIVHEIDRSRGEHIVVVGHSQGSVLAACVVNRWREAAEENLEYARHFRLLTCGSPLGSLYAAFFPAHFDDAFFKGTRANSADAWVNCWRSSDAIASSVDSNLNIQLRDPREPETVDRGHGDYWTDVVQRGVVERLRAGQSVVQIAEEVGVNFPDDKFEIRELDRSVEPETH